MDFNNLFSLATGSCHLLIFALLCDNTVVVVAVVVIVVWMFCGKKKTILPEWVDVGE